MLKGGGIAFSPALPSAKVASMNKIGMDFSLRIVIDFKKNFLGAIIPDICGEAPRAPCTLMQGWRGVNFTELFE